jgi:uncharacterized membrane protein
MNYLITTSQLLGIEMEGTTGFIVRFLLNLITLFLLIRVLYYGYRREGVPEFLFSFFLLGVIVFLVCTALEMVEVQLGFALGLFALFGILRFRTESIPVREMTYMFLSIGIAMINSLVDFMDPINGIILSNTLVILPVWALESFLSSTGIGKQELVYDNLEDVYAGEEALAVKIEEKTGFKIRRIRITRIDMQAGKANITIYYHKK